MPFHASGGPAKPALLLRPWNAAAPLVASAILALIFGWFGGPLVAVANIILVAGMARSRRD